jgi:hypothetical protein
VHMGAACSVVDGMASIVRLSSASNPKKTAAIEWHVTDVPGQLEALLALLFDGLATDNQNDNDRPPRAGHCNA